MRAIPLIAFLVTLAFTFTVNAQSTQPSQKQVILQTPVTPGGQEVAEGVTVLHGPTKLPFPAKLEGFERISVTAYNADATDMSAGYRNDELRMTVTLYLYPQPNLSRDDGGEIAPADAFKALIDHESEQVMRFEPKLKPGSGGTVEDLGLVTNMAGWQVFATDGPTDRFPVAVQSVLALAMVKPDLADRPYLAKIRATLPVENSEKARTALLLAMADWLVQASPDDDDAPTTQPATQPRTPPDEEADYTHSPTGITLPMRLADMPRIDIHEFDDTGRDVSGGYVNIKTGLSVTLYIYPLKGTAQELFDNAIGEVESAHPNWALLGAIKIDRDEKVFGTGYAGRFDSQQEPTPWGVPILSDVWLFPLSKPGNDGERYVVKMRATFPQVQKAEVDPMLEKILIEWLKLTPDDVKARPQKDQ